MNIKEEVRIKKQRNEYRCFLEPKFLGVNRLFALIYSNQDGNAERYKARKYYLPKDIAKNYKVIINGRNFYDQQIDSDVKRYEKIRKLTTGQSEDYTTGCLLDYYYIKNY